MFKCRPVLVLGLALATQSVLPRTATAGWTKLSSMMSARDAFPVAMNPGTGNIFILGGRFRNITTGSYKVMINAESIAGVTSNFVPAGSLRYARSYMPAVPIIQTINGISGPTTKFLLPGGFSSTGTMRTAEIYDVAGNGGASTTGSMSSYRELFDAVSLKPPSTSGYAQILAIGGYWGGYNRAQSTCELYDPARGVWSSTASLRMGRFGTASLLLPDGRVMVVGGRTEPGDVSLSSVEYYTPAAGKVAAAWKASVDVAHSLQSSRFRHTMTVVGYTPVPVNGATKNYPILLITGGYSGNNASGRTLNTAELGLYDNTVGQYKFQNLNIWRTDTNSAGGLSCVYAGRMDHTATLLANEPLPVVGALGPKTLGPVLIVAGWDGITNGPGTTIGLMDLLTITATTDADGNTTYAGSLQPLGRQDGFPTRHEHTALAVTVNDTPGALVCGGLQYEWTPGGYAAMTLQDAWLYTADG
jgi:hypothetical protein